MFKNLFYLLPRIFVEKNFLILLSYFRLYIASFLHHHFIKQSLAEEKQTLVLGYKIFFYNYPTLINQFEEIFIYKSYKFKSAKVNPLIIDCGSNIGISILYFKIFHPDARILAFEPDPENFRLLEKNIAQNNLKGITIHGCALGKSEGFCKLYKTQADEGAINSSIISQKPEQYFVNVPMKLLSSFLEEDIDFIKMDVEGAESEIINEVVNSGKIGRIKQMVLEFHSKTQNESELISRLNHAGFNLNSRIRPYENSHELILGFKGH